VVHYADWRTDQTVSAGGLLQARCRSAFSSGDAFMTAGVMELSRRQSAGRKLDTNSPCLELALSNQPAKGREQKTTRVLPTTRLVAELKVTTVDVPITCLTTELPRKYVTS